MICKGTNTPYHQQDQETWCGHAVAQMMLADPALLEEIVEQAVMPFGSSLTSRVVNAFRSMVGLDEPSTTWDATPADLQNYFNRLIRSNDPERRFKIEADCEKLLGIQRIAASIVSKPLGVPALVYGIKHWIVIAAVMLNRDPALGSYSVEGFFIHDPEPRMTNVHSHLLVGDPCGTGNEYGSRYTYVTTFDWLHRVWTTPLDEFGIVGYVTIPYGGKPPQLPLSPVCRAPFPYRLPLSDSDAVSVVRSEIDRHCLKTEGPLAEILAHVDPSGTLPVGSDGNSQDWHLVALFDTVHKAISGTARVARDTGEFLGVQAPRSSGAPMIEIWDDASTTLGNTADRLFDLVRSNPRFVSVPFPADARIAPALAWRPSRQSMSPFRPFFQVERDSERWYVAFDGSVYTQLDPHP